MSSQFPFDQPAFLNNPEGIIRDREKRGGRDLFKEYAADLQVVTPWELRFAFAVLSRGVDYNASIMAEGEGKWKYQTHPHRNFQRIPGEGGRVEDLEPMREVFFETLARIFLALREHHKRGFPTAGRFMEGIVELREKELEGFYRDFRSHVRVLGAEKIRDYFTSGKTRRRPPETEEFDEFVDDMVTKTKKAVGLGEDRIAEALKKRIRDISILGPAFDIIFDDSVLGKLAVAKKALFSSAELPAKVIDASRAGRLSMRVRSIYLMDEKIGLSRSCPHCCTIARKRARICRVCHGTLWNVDELFKGSTWIRGVNTFRVAGTYYI